MHDVIEAEGADLGEAVGQQQHPPHAVVRASELLGASSGNESHL